MPLTTFAKVKTWALSNEVAQADSARDVEIMRCIDAVSGMLPRITSRVYEQETFVRYFDGGNHTYRGTLSLHPGHRPVIHVSPTTLVAVQEDGISLSVGIGYSTTADVILRGANEDMPCDLVRQGTWSRGTQNIKVSYVAGYSALDIPFEVEQVANWMTWLMYTEPERFAKASDSKGGVGFSFTREMPSDILACFNSLRVLF